MKRSLATSLALVCLFSPAFLMAAPETEKPAIVKGYALPKDKDAAVVTFDVRGGSPFLRINHEPTLTVLADGRVRVPACYPGQKSFEGQLTQAELQELLEFILGKQKFFEYDPKKVEAKLAAKFRAAAPVVGGAVRYVRVQTEGKTHEATLSGPGCDMHRDIEELQQLSAVTFRLEKLRFFVMLGGTPKMKEYLEKANEKLKATHPTAAPLDLTHVKSAVYRDDGSRAIDFRREVKNAAGERTGLTDVSIYISPAGEMRIGAQHTAD